MGKYGLALDNLRSVELVTAEGQVLRASKDEQPICSGPFEVEVEISAWRLPSNISLIRSGPRSPAAWSRTRSTAPATC